MGETRKPVRPKEGNPGSILCWEDEATDSGKKAERLKERPKQGRLRVRGCL